MSSFIDGPAANVDLHLRRAPLMLRVVRSPRGKWDALDQLDDTPKPNEQIFVYVCQHVHMRGFMCCRGKHKAASGRFESGTYAFLPEQPADEDVRDNARWVAWCRAKRQKLDPTGKAVMPEEDARG